jgi:hypothetical protein
MLSRRKNAQKAHKIRFPSRRRACQKPLRFVPCALFGGHAINGN